MRPDRAGEKRFAELAARAARTGTPQKTGFLTPAERAEAEICARGAGVRAEESGGFAEAERRVVLFVPDDLQTGAYPPPVCCVETRWPARFGALAHRDLLGAILSLGFEREKFGDILVGEGVAHVFTLAELAPYVEANWTRAGAVPITACRAEAPPDPARDAGTLVRATVSSLRLDALLGAAFRVSRGKACELVARGAVQVDYRPELKPDRQLAEGALLSVRGMGRARLATVGGRTKKDRISVALLRY